MSLGNDRIRRLIFVLLPMVAFLGLAYGLSLVRDAPPWLRSLVQLAHLAALVLAFCQLQSAKEGYAHVVRGLLIVLGLVFAFSLNLYGVSGFRFFLSWHDLMATWSGWMIGLGLVSWLPPRWMYGRGVSKRGWETEWFAWTSSLLAIAALYAVTMTAPAWVSATWADVVTAKPDFVFVYAPLRALLGLICCLITLVYIRMMPRLLPGRRFLWSLQFVLGAFLVAIPLIIPAEALPMGIRRVAADISRHWEYVSFAGRILLLASVFGVFSRKPEPELVNANSARQVR